MKMDIDSASILGGEIDKSQVPPIDQKRIIAFVNHFILNTCTFLNDFAIKCEDRFIQVERKLQKVEASLIIIEEKLSSIPGLEDKPKLIETISEVKIVDKPIADVQIVEETKPESEPEPVNNEIIENPTEVEESKGVQACLDIRYKKFFKMVQFGVPPAAVKLKMKSEGLDPEVLETTVYNKYFANMDQESSNTPKLILQDGIAVEEMES